MVSALISGRNGFGPFGEAIDACEYMSMSTHKMVEVDQQCRHKFERMNWEMQLVV